MRLILRDTNLAVVAALSDAFADCPDVNVSHGDIRTVKADAIVSPANSFGYMDGGIDLVYRTAFGMWIERALQARIERLHGGELPVGEATAIETHHPEVPLMIVAPTMRKPGPLHLGSLNAYLAMRAALRLAAERDVQRLLCPGMCTLTGRMAPGEAARQMRLAYGEHAGLSA